MIDEKYFLKACVECDRVFDLLNYGDALEYAYGHDCEVEK